MMKKLAAIKINCPQYLGAPYPPFDPLAINESKIAFTARLKDVSQKVTGDTIEYFWVSQEDPTKKGAASVIKEIRRCLVCRMKALKMHGVKVKLVLHYTSRDYWDKLNDPKNKSERAISIK